jgi:hypothetical protein
VRGLAAATLLALSTTAFAQKVISPAIPVESQDTAFIKAVNTSLELLRTRAPQDYEFARQHVRLIKQVETWNEVGMAVRANPPTAKLRRQEAQESVTWLAGVIVHEACHRFQYLRGLERHGGPFPPRWEYSGRISELECLKRQAETLERIGAPAREIDYVRRADGLHYRRVDQSKGFDRWDPSNTDPREPAARP